MHRDLRNAPDFPVVVRAVGKYNGGGLWIESDHGPVPKVLPTGERRAGNIFDIAQEAVSFLGSLWHAPEEWEGASRWVITGFVPRVFETTTREQWALLEELGFPVGGLTERLESEPLVKAMREECENIESAEWTIDMPCWIVQEGDLEAWISWHEATVCLRRFVVEDLSAMTDGDGLLVPGAEQLLRIERECEWLEVVLQQCQAENEAYGSVRALQIEVPLNESDSTGDQFLLGPLA